MKNTKITTNAKIRKTQFFYISYSVQSFSEPLKFSKSEQLDFEFERDFLSISDFTATHILMTCLDSSSKVLSKFRTFYWEFCTVISFLKRFELQTAETLKS